MDNKERWRILHGLFDGADNLLPYLEDLARIERNDTAMGAINLLLQLKAQYTGTYIYTTAVLKMSENTDGSEGDIITAYHQPSDWEWTGPREPSDTHTGIMRRGNFSRLASEAEAQMFRQIYIDEHE